MKNDKFYTKKNIAKKYLEIFLENIKDKQYDFILEPSAGNGSFFYFLDTKKRIGIDIEPEDENKEILKQDFLSFEPMKNKKYVCIGNPPFGRVSSLAVLFFNKAASFSEAIGFILPRTFKRISIVNRLNENFHLIYEEDVPKNSFYPNMNAKCVFQIWIKKEQIREKIKLIEKTEDFIFTDPKKSDFAILAYGGKCGRIENNIPKTGLRSWHFIKSKIDKDTLIKDLKALDFSFSEDTVRQNSLGKKELINAYELYKRGKQC